MVFVSQALVAFVRKRDKRVKGYKVITYRYLLSESSEAGWCMCILSVCVWCVYFISKSTTSFHVDDVGRKGSCKTEKS